VSEGILRVGRRADGIGTVTDHDTADDRVKFQGFHHGSSYLEHLDFLAAIRAGSSPSVTLEDGLWSVAVGEAAHRSIDERRWVEVAELFEGAGE
jgi:predicted dehydrogenase